MSFSLSKNIVLHVCVDLVLIVIWMSMLLIITIAKKENVHLFEIIYYDYT